MAAQRQPRIGLGLSARLNQLGQGKSRNDQLVEDYFNRVRSTPASSAGAGTVGAPSTGLVTPQTANDSDRSDRGGDGPSGSSGTTAGNDDRHTMASPAGVSFGYNGQRGMAGLSALGPVGLLGGVTVSPRAAVYDVNPASILSVDPRTNTEMGYFGREENGTPSTLGEGFTSIGGNFGIGSAYGAADAVGARSSIGEGGWTSNSGSADSSDTSGTSGNSSSSADTNDGRAGFYRGGRVTRERLSGPNPRGPDDGYAALDEDEFLIKSKQAKKLGFTKLKALNAGKADIVIKG